MRYQVVTRQQSPKHNARGFGGPDTYVAVLHIPDEAVVPGCLNRKILEKRGIRIEYFGVGYKKHDSMRSMLGKAIDAALDRVIDLENGEA